MTGIALHGFDIAAVQLELVCNAGVSEAVENHFGEDVYKIQGERAAVPPLPHQAQ